MATVASAGVCACSPGAFSARHRHRERLNSPFSPLSPPVWPELSLKHSGAKISRCPNPVAVLPLLSLAAEISQPQVQTVYHDWKLDEMGVKNIFLCFSLFFVWGCCVFGSMKDPFYDSDLYRGEGGDGSGNWLYQLEEEEEVRAREELWREELTREIEERVGELRESKEEKELV